jgi:hypothetical protein
LFLLLFSPERVHPRGMTYGLADPQLSTDERLAEVAELLAAGLLRLRLRSARQSSSLSRDGGESSLDRSPDRSMHADPQRRGSAA